MCKHQTASVHGEHYQISSFISGYHSSLNDSQFFVGKVIYVVFVALLFSN